MHLTKSLFLEYLDCPLHMWLQERSSVAPKPLSLYDQHLLEQGYEVETLAKQFVRQHVKLTYSREATVEFEVTLTSGPYQSRIDALVHDPETGIYDLYEIKSSTDVKPEHKADVTFQYLIAKELLPIRHVWLIHVNGDYRRAGDLNLRELFVIEDMAPHIQKKEAAVLQQRSDAWSTLRRATMPQEGHCFNPTKCPYPTQCFPHLPEFSIYDLEGARRKLYRQLIDSDYQHLVDIPLHLLKRRKHQWQVQAAQTQQPVADWTSIREQFASLTFPLYFLDYETFPYPAPPYDGYKPYQQVVTQFSVHVLPEPGAAHLEHHEYLVTQPGDPSRQVAQALTQCIGGTGSVIVWNQSFECGRNKEMAELQPEYATQLLSINERVYDLMELFRKGEYVDHRFHGSYSIKYVLPVLVPELSYHGMAVSDGTTAMLQWRELVHGKLPTAEKETITQNLLKYCELDTLAMVEIWRRMHSELE